MKLTLRRATLQTPSARDARRSWPERQRLLIRISEPAQLCGIGEATPLPGYSPDTMDDVEAALRRVDTEALGRELAVGSWQLAVERVGGLVAGSLPAARMGLESAALDYLARREGVSAPRLLGAAPEASVRLAFLLGAASATDLLERAGGALQQGFTHFKVKLGAPGRLREEIAGVVGLRDALGSSVSLRLDANGALSAHELTEAWKALSRCGIELFEEPGEVPAALVGEIPLALDESLQGLEPNEVAARAKQRQACAVVLKPTALGGISHCWRVAERARDLGVAVVISHCFEGALAFRAAASLALALPFGLAHGLAPYAGLGAAPVRSGSLCSWSEPGLGEPETLA